MNDFGLTEVQSAAILANIGHECAGFKQMQETAPTGGGKGGLGWCNWTGPRRRQFENFLAGRPAKDDEANYGFMKQELETTEAKAISDLKNTSTLEDGVKAFELVFERAHPNFKHYESRNKWGEAALDAFRASPSA